MHEPLLCSTECPIYRTPLEAASRALVSQINQAIAATTLRTLSDSPVLDPIDQLLVDPQQRVAYPVREGVPCIKGYEAIAIAPAAAAQHHAPQDYRKLLSEFDFWVSVRLKRGALVGEDAYLHVIERDFAQPRAAFSNARILDIGCGPLGSLEWADRAALRVGLDPLADAYRQLGTSAQQMDYVAADAEHIPFPENFFDYVLSFNSLDHVDKLEAAVQEIVRVLAPGGRFLLVSDIHDEPTVNEPTTFDWNITKRFAPLHVEHELHLEKSLPGVYESIAAHTLFDHANPARRYGVLLALLRKPETMGVRVPSSSERLVVKESVAELRRSVSNLPPHVRRVLCALLRADVERNAAQSGAETAQGISHFTSALFSKPPFALTGAALDREVARYYMRYGLHHSEVLNHTFTHISAIAASTPAPQQQQALTQLLRQIFGEDAFA